MGCKVMVAGTDNYTEEARSLRNSTVWYRVAITTDRRWLATCQWIWPAAQGIMAVAVTRPDQGTTRQKKAMGDAADM